MSNKVPSLRDIVERNANANILLPIMLPWWLRQERINLQCRRPEFDPRVGKIPWRRERLPIPIFWPGEFHGQRSLAGYNPRDHKESDMTEGLRTYT